MANAFLSHCSFIIFVCFLYPCWLFHFQRCSTLAWKWSYIYRQLDMNANAICFLAYLYNLHIFHSQWFRMFDGKRKDDEIKMEKHNNSSSVMFSMRIATRSIAPMKRYNFLFEMIFNRIDCDRKKKLDRIKMI